MENTDVVDMLTRLKRKCAINEEENRKKWKIIVGTIIYVIVIVMHLYNKSVLLKEPSNDWDQERQSFLGRLFNGKDSTCIEQLRVSKSAFKRLCEILQRIGGLVRTRHVSIEESVTIVFFRVIGLYYYHSKETISRQFHNVLHAMMKISQEYVKYQPCVISNFEREKWRWFEKLDPIEVYDEVNAIPDLSEEEQIKACAWLIENDKQFLMLKTLPVEKKKNMTHHIVTAINCWKIYSDFN
ncbi:hypothetical protein DVH24_014122 [Malus domestica]|uniref:DUF8040 domain-containing protein n=1 Tax=Malus domestica TaxID=3750 RepID=A0A498JEK4_MALDO|nr:hypothetical protein DVH24_014122 [Malus domestica]